MRFYNASLRSNESLDDRKNATTRADQAAQNEVISRLKGDERYATDGLIAEERPFNDETAVMSRGYTWVIDPLDGTANFDSRLPFFCSAVGCLRDGEPHIGVVFDPVENEVYYAMEGVPTEVWNISRGEVSAVKSDSGRTTLAESLLGMHISSRGDIAERFVGSGVLLELSKRVRHLRALGSGQLALAYVASGRLQGFCQLDTYLWDQVAGVVLVRNAGGCATDLRTRVDWRARTKDLLATSNRNIRDEFLAFWAERATP